MHFTLVTFLVAAAAAAPIDLGDLGDALDERLADAIIDGRDNSVVGCLNCETVFDTCMGGDCAAEMGAAMKSEGPPTPAFVAAASAEFQALHACIMAECEEGDSKADLAKAAAAAVASSVDDAAPLPGASIDSSPIETSTQAGGARGRRWFFTLFSWSDIIANVEVLKAEKAYHDLCAAEEEIHNQNVESLQASFHWFFTGQLELPFTCSVRFEDLAKDAMKDSRELELTDEIAVAGGETVLIYEKIDFGLFLGERWVLKEENEAIAARQRRQSRRGKVIQLKRATQNKYTVGKSKIMVARSGGLSNNFMKAD